MKLTIAEVKRRLPAGAKFTGEFCGRLNTRVISNTGATSLVKPENERRTQRIVRKQSSEMVSEFLSGPRIGQLIYCAWKGVSAREEAGDIILSQEIQGRSEDFLRIQAIEIKEAVA